MLAFDESYMGAFTKAASIPGTSRVQKVRAKSPRSQKAKGGLPRSCVLVVRDDPMNYRVFVKGSGALLGTVRAFKGAKGKTYSYKLVSEPQGHPGFPTQKAAVDRMLTQV